MTFRQFSTLAGRTKLLFVVLGCLVALTSVWWAPSSNNEIVPAVTLDLVTIETMFPI